MGNSSLTASIHILDDDCLINVFYLYRPFILGEDGNEDARVIGGDGRWDRERWWYKLAHVCQKWRNVLLRSTAYLGVSLVCTNGTPVADMLAHSPPLPLVVEYSLGEDSNITAEDEEGAILALKQYNRVRRVRLQMSYNSMRNLIGVMDDEYPIMEYLIIGHYIGPKSTILTFPETFQAPHLRHTLLCGFSLPIGSRLLTTAVGLVTLCLLMVHPSTYFHPNTLLHWLSSMPQLEIVHIRFSFADSNRDVEGQLIPTPITTPVILPNLLIFRFRGVRAYLEELVHRTVAPRLHKLEIWFFNQLTFPLPRLLQFANAAKNLRFESAELWFSGENVGVELYRQAETETCSLSFTVFCCRLDWKISSAAQILDSLGPMFSAVENLVLENGVHNRSSEVYDEADGTEWRKLLNPFRNVKTLRIAGGLVNDLSCCLQMDDGEDSLVLLPKLQELKYFGRGNTGDAFTRLIDSRQNAGCPITVVRS